MSPLKNLTDQQLLDRLADLTDRLPFCRGLNASYEFCKMDIEDIQAEIEARKLAKQGCHDTNNR